MSFDSTIYKIFADRQELLQKLRNSVLSFINDVIFKNTPYRIMWPQLGENASANAEWYNKENDEGNEICNVKSAIVFNNNNIESVAIISTKV